MLSSGYECLETNLNKNIASFVFLGDPLRETIRLTVRCCNDCDLFSGSCSFKAIYLSQCLSPGITTEESVTTSLQTQRAKKWTII